MMAQRWKSARSDLSAGLAGHSGMWLAKRALLLQWYTHSG
jgi:hypothetical protein